MSPTRCKIIICCINCVNYCKIAWCSYLYNNAHMFLNVVACVYKLIYNTILCSLYLSLFSNRGARMSGLWMMKVVWRQKIWCPELDLDGCSYVHVLLVNIACVLNSHTVLSFKTVIFPKKLNFFTHGTYMQGGLSSQKLCLDSKCLNYLSPIYSSFLHSDH